ncbi:MAG: hypothetical protein IJ062_05175 [Firmicutes bacterium]|nr:hypothetical protein [Bacillota bacterium]
MKLWPVIKAEFKRSSWVLWAVLLFMLPLCGGRAVGTIKDDVYGMSRWLDSSAYFTDSMQENICLCGIWAAVLLVIVQYIKDYPNFTRALPYTGRQLILGKSVTAVVIAAANSVIYVVMMFMLTSKYDWYIKTVYWSSDDTISAGYIVLCAFTAFLVMLAAYWYVSLCCCVSKNVYIGVGLAFLGMMTLTAFTNLLDEINFYDILTKFRDFLSHIAPESYAVSLFMIFLAVTVLVPSFFGALKLYGGGESSHPLFRYGAVNKIAILLLAVLFASFAPDVTGMYDNIPLALMIGGAVGLALGIGFNKLVIRRCRA